MGFDINHQTVLGAIRSEAKARAAAISDLQKQVSGLGTNLAGYSAVLQQLAPFADGTASFNASALVGRIGLTQIQPGFALASDLLTLEAEVTGNNTTNTAAIQVLSETIATETSALAQIQTTLTATVQNNNVQTNASITQTAIAAATATAAVASTVTALTATVISDVATLNASITTEATTRATADSALATSITTLTSTVTTDVTTINASISSEATTRATADSAISSTVNTLSSAWGTTATVFSQGTTPTALAVGDIWNNTSTSAIKYWNGSAWTGTFVAPTAISSALATATTTAETFATSAVATAVTSLTASIAGVSSSVTTEASARAAADANLSSNYSVTVTAGNIVTGMQLNSSSGGGATSSVIAFEASTFKVSDGASNYPVFTISGGVVTVGTELDVGTGTNRCQIRSTGLTFGGYASLQASGTFGVLSVGSGGNVVNISAVTGSTSIVLEVGGVIQGTISNAAVAALASMTLSSTLGVTGTATFGAVIASTLNLGTTGASPPGTSAAPGTYQITNVFGGGGGHFMIGTPIGWMTINDTGGTPHLVPYYS